MDIKPRRPPQPPIDPALVVRGAEFAKNRAEHVGKPQILVVVDCVVDAGVPTVFYYYKGTDRRHNMPLGIFCRSSEHRLPDPEPTPVPAEPVEEPPQSGERETAVDVPAMLRAICETQKEILAILKRRGPEQLTLGVSGTR